MALRNGVGLGAEPEAEVLVVTTAELRLGHKRRVAELGERKAAPVLEIASEAPEFRDADDQPGEREEELVLVFEGTRSLAVV
jgi:hypothetical protein